MFEFRLALEKNLGGRIGLFGFDGMKNVAQGKILRQPREALRQPDQVLRQPRKALRQPSQVLR